MTATERKAGRVEGSGSDTIVLPLPGDRAGNAFLEAHGLLVIELAACALVGRALVARVMELGFEVADEAVGLAALRQDHVRDGFDVVQLVPGDVVDRARPEALADRR